MEQSSIVKILIVDDNKDGAFMLRLLMKTLISADIRIAFDGTSGIEKVDEFKPTYVIIDMTLPDISGQEVAQIIKEKYPETTIIGISGFSEEDLSIDKYYFSEFWTKPILPEKIEVYFAN